MINMQTSGLIVQLNSHLVSILDHPRLLWNYQWIKNAKKKQRLRDHEYMHGVGLCDVRKHRDKKLIKPPINSISGFLIILIR